MALAKGRMVGSYRLERLLGEGGMGVVWEAADTRVGDGEKVALKFLKPAALANTALVKRVLREARAAMAVEHPNVVRIRELIGDEAGPVIVKDYLVGGSLGDRLGRQGKLSLSAFAAIFLPVVSAIGTAHAQGIVHRDLKPDNIFIAEGEQVKLLDFGIAKLTERRAMR